MTDVLAWAFSDLTTTGPDPFSSNASANSSSPGASTITVNSPGIVISITDDDSEFSDGDSDQRYWGPSDFNGGVGYDVGDRIETEYSYVIRPTGSLDPADNITIYMLEIDADGQGIAADKPLSVGTTYDIVSVDSSNPVVPYSNLYICFASGTRISTPTGQRPVETLKPGDLVNTLDDGPQPILWCSARKIDLTGTSTQQLPVLIKQGALGPGVPENDLVVSPQHRFLARDHLVRAKSLLVCSGVREMRGLRSITYHALLLSRHQILFAERALAESLLLGPVTLAILSDRERREVTSLTTTHSQKAARPILTKREGETLARHVFDQKCIARS